MQDKLKEIYLKLQNMPLPWVQDPKTKEASVSLTLMIISFTAYLVSAILVLMGKVTSAGPLEELMYSTMGLYFGRKWTSKKGDKETTLDKG